MRFESSIRQVYRDNAGFYVRSKQGIHSASRSRSRTNYAQNTVRNTTAIAATNVQKFHTMDPKSQPKRGPLASSSAPIVSQTVPHLTVPSKSSRISPQISRADNARIAQNRQHNIARRLEDDDLGPKHHWRSTPPAEPFFGTTACRIGLLLIQ